MTEETKKKLHRYKVIIDITAVIIVLAIWLLGYINNGRGRALADGTVEVHVIDVGQADCTLIRTEAGNILIDAGSNETEDLLLKYLKNYRIKSFEYCIFTHPHEDHIGGGDRIVSYCRVKNIIMPETEVSDTTYERLSDAIAASEANVIYAKYGDEFSLGDVHISVLAPVVADEYHDENNKSAVTRISYGDMDFLFMGDAEYIEESDMIIAGALSPTEFLKVGHHGSSTSTTAEFLLDVTPQIAVISCGVGNLYGHPNYETIERLEASGAKCFRTDTEGTLVFVSDGEKIEFDNKRSGK